MPEAKPRFANFPEREPKVVIGAHISATTARTLTRLTIGTYEMSVTQQENAHETADAIKSALTALAKANAMQVGSEQSRDFVCVMYASGNGERIQLWATTPFELTQSGHLVWCKATNEARIGIAFKLATAFTPDDIANLIKSAQRNLTEVPAGEPYTLKGNPPPRFQKKEKTAAPTAEPAT